MAASGVLSGKPTHAGAFAFTVMASDKYGYAGLVDYSVTITAPTIHIAPATLPPGTLAQRYAAKLTSNGGGGPYKLAVVGGALPPGLTLAAAGAGAIGGRPTSTGSFPVTIQATDRFGYTGTAGFTVDIT